MLSLQVKVSHALLMVGVRDIADHCQYQSNMNYPYSWPVSHASFAHHWGSLELPHHANMSCDSDALRSAGQARPVAAMWGNMEAHSVVHLVALAVHELLQARGRIIQAEPYDLQAAVLVLLCNP